MEDYRVNLDIYNGPLDLLLYLIRREEVDIYDIPIARVTDQYVRHVETLRALDPNLAGEFLVMAATLMEIKTRMLLPTPPPEEGGEDGLEIDPRAELVRQLLEYKAFKDAAGDLADAADERSRRFARRPDLPDLGEDELELEDVQVWDLVDAFDRLMAEIGMQVREHEVIYDDTPLELHAEDLMDRLRREGMLTFRQVFEGRTTRSEIVGLFLAMLELVRSRAIFANQQRDFGEIYIRANPNPPAEDDEGEAPGDIAGPPVEEDGDDAGATGEGPGDREPPNGSADAEPADAYHGPTAPPAAPEPGDDADAGTYVPEPREDDDGDERGREASGTGA